MPKYWMYLYTVRTYWKCTQVTKMETWARTDYPAMETFGVLFHYSICSYITLENIHLSALHLQ